MSSIGDGDADPAAALAVLGTKVYGIVSADDEAATLACRASPDLKSDALLRAWAELSQAR